MRELRVGLGTPQERARPGGVGLSAHVCWVSREEMVSIQPLEHGEQWDLGRQRTFPDEICHVHPAGGGWPGGVSAQLVHPAPPQCHSLAGEASTGTYHVQRGNLPPPPLSEALWSGWIQMTVSAPPLYSPGLAWMTAAAS